MDKELLKRILTDYNRVVIPNFGAFLRKQQGEGLVFSPFLKSDDGIVVDIVAKEYSISIDDARSMVDEFVSHIRGVLASKSKYYIDDLGILIVDSNGAISFITESPKPTPIVASAPIPAPMPAITHNRIMPQPIVQPMAQPMAPQPIAQQPMAQQMAPQPIAQPRAGMAAPISAGPFARPAAPAPMPTVPSPIGQIAKPQPAPASAPIPPMQNGTQVARPQNAPQGQPRRRPQPAKKSSKNDIWLIVAILAALIVVVIMVIALITTSGAEQFQIQ